MKFIWNLLHTRWPAILWTLGIFILLSIPGKDIPEGPGIPHLDKVAHFILCGVHVWLWSYYLNSKLKDKSKQRRLFLLVFLITCIYGILMEYYQLYFVPNRGFEFDDMVADALGAAAGWLISIRTIKSR